jgi:mannose-6-phosphate isomerase-like protein (cupin superfamily)
MSSADPVNLAGNSTRREEGCMIVQRKSGAAFDFEGVSIVDYTASASTSSSVAHVTVPAGARHRRAVSDRSDKYYVILAGTLAFDLDTAEETLRPGDLCIVDRGTPFGYANRGTETVELLLVHTPSFDLEAEHFLE